MSPTRRVRDTAGQDMRPEPEPEKVAAAVARLATYRDEPEPEPEPEPTASVKPNGKPGAGELAKVRRAAAAHDAAREELYEAMRRARAVDPPPSLREVAAAAGLSHAHVHREVG